MSFDFCAAVFALGFILAFVSWCLYIRFSPFHVLVNRIPGPKFHLPLLGNSLELAGGLDNVLHMFQEKWPEKYGEVYRIFLGNHCYVVISTPELLETILSSQKIIDKGSSYVNLVPWLGLGLLVSSGDLWRSRRKLLTPAFHFSILNSFVEVFNEQSRILCGIIEDICQSFADGKSEMDVYPLITRCSLDIICEASMGTTINAQTKDSEYVRAVYRIGQVIVQQFQQPWLEIPWIFSVSALGREHNRLLKILHGFTEDVIHKRREALNKKGNKKTGEIETGMRNRLPLLDLLIKTSDDGKVLSNQDIRNEIDTFMFEGHDTVSSLMGWFLYCMATNTDCQDKVRTELDDLFGDSERDCSEEDIPNLKYLECCIKETLRLYPSVPLFDRTILEDVQIGKYLIPAGCTVACPTFATHRNPKTFPDPLVFNPERFFPDEAVGRHPYAYIPFSAGPRNCIGQRFAMLETKVVLSTLLRRFKFEVSANTKPPIRSTQLILKSMNGINLVVSRR
ncbi:cytochrome P450 4C1-like [Daphnia pulicaria]|uniref:cytochrome P450 4C1-like n=1 Tax=Daphnia pulicaria TaxID=35523 RepID=UPI001EEC09A8|nr:cytochrome P450 4C1-like [Daphnia pulicaria]